jgi:hypothetical protein
MNHLLIDENDDALPARCRYGIAPERQYCLERQQ